MHPAVEDRRERVGGLEPQRLGPFWTAQAGRFVHAMFAVVYLQGNDSWIPPATWFAVDEVLGHGF